VTDNQPILDQLKDLLRVETYGEIVPAVETLKASYDALVVSSIDHAAGVDELMAEIRKLLV
jgi:hypothetical protein